MTIVSVNTQPTQEVVVTVQPPVTVEVYRKGDIGKSAYQSYLDTTSDDPVLSEEVWAAATQIFGTTEKKTGIDAGYLNEMSITNDYLYICVLGGTAGEAIWKKLPMFISI